MAGRELAQEPKSSDHAELAREGGMSVSIYLMHRSQVCSHVPIGKRPYLADVDKGDGFLVRLRPLR